MKRFLGPLCFVAFCFLISFRDVLTDLLQVEKGIHPTFLLLTWSVECAVLAWVVRSWRRRSLGFVRPFLQLKRQQKLDFIKLGIATWVVYVVTVHCIGILSAPVFNLLDYGTMPMLMLLTAYWINEERINARQIVGAFFSVCGIGLLLYVAFNPTIPMGTSWPKWIALSFLSPLFTSVCSSLQRKQVAENMTPDEVLLYRFPIPAVLMIVWFCAAKYFETPSSAVVSPLSSLPSLLLIGALTFFLPLWLLCYAFVYSSVGQLAAYLFLIPVFTFVLGPLLVNREWNRILLPEIWGSAILLLIGYCVAEGFIKQSGKAKGAGA
jgi:drug/metabolite transporter (DMT)-like permease